MKESDVRRILNHVWGNFRCPHCEGSLHSGETKINSNTSLGVSLTIKCASCSVVINVNGFLPGKIRHEKKTSQNLDSLQKIKIDIEKIKKFNGENITDLFK